MSELLPWLNVLILPALAYIVRLERRIMRLEILLAVKLGLDPDTLERRGGLNGN